MRYFDLYHGRELKPEREGGDDALSFTIEPHGYGAILATRNQPDATQFKLMETMRGLTAKELAAYSAEWSVLQQRLVDIPRTEPAAATPDGMAAIPPAHNYLFKVAGIEIEGGNDIGLDVQYPWEPAPRRFHEHTMDIPGFYMDKYPVTNEQFKAFLDATRYHPKDGLNFLKDWKYGTYPVGGARKPVTWVSLEDARTYAVWAGKRLPHEWEWQYAAQGNDSRLYPWGNAWNAALVPSAQTGRAISGPADIDAHPAGASPFGVVDLIGNVWQITDEYQDDRTRAAILRGGSYYKPQGSIWYFPQAYRNDQHGKLLLMAPSYDRSATVGFRCVKDASGHSEGAM